MESTPLACVALKTRTTTESPIKRQLIKIFKLAQPKSKYHEKLRIRKGLTHRTGVSIFPVSPVKDHYSFSHLLENGILVKPYNTGLIKPVERPPKRQISMSQEMIKAELNANFLIIHKTKISSLDHVSPVKPDRESSKSPLKQTPKYEPPVRPKKRPPKKPEPVSIKEIMRDKEWMAKARPQIVRDFNNMLNKSNGMNMEPPSEPFFTYKYCLEKGNNSPLVKSIFKNRWYWSRVPIEEKELAHLCWTQLRDKNFIESLPTLQDPPTLEGQRATVVCKTKYIDPKSPNLLSAAKNVDILPLGYALIHGSDSMTTLKTTDYTCANARAHNKLEGNFHISNKKGLFYNLKAYYDSMGRDVFNVIPFTLHLAGPEELQELEAVFGNFKSPYWIVKPGENTNRGHGITLCSSLEQVKATLSSNPYPGTGAHTFIVQKYVDRPFLINRRKFDIRCFAMVTCLNGVVQGYFYNEGYLRTASKAYNLQEEDRFIHLTNDAVQKDSEDYGKFENGNKLSYSDFQRYLDNCYPERKAVFAEDILPQMKEIVKHTIEAVSFKIDKEKRTHTFEIFGYDFLLDSDLKVWLLEANTNPCLEVSSPILARILPAMLDNAFRIAVDPVFQEPLNANKKVCTDPLFENRFELVFHSYVEGLTLSADPVVSKALEADIAIEDS